MKQLRCHNTAGYSRMIAVRVRLIAVYRLRFLMNDTSAHIMPNSMHNIGRVINIAQLTKSSHPEMCVQPVCRKEPVLCIYGAAFRPELFFEHVGSIKSSMYHQVLIDAKHDLRLNAVAGLIIILHRHEPAGKPYAQAVRRHITRRLCHNI